MGRKVTARPTTEHVATLNRVVAQLKCDEEFEPEARAKICELLQKAIRELSLVK